MQVKKNTRETVFNRKKVNQMFIVAFHEISIPKQPSIMLAPLSVFNFALTCILNCLIDVFRQCIVSHQNIFIITILPGHYKLVVKSCNNSLPMSCNLIQQTSLFLYSKACNMWPSKRILKKGHLRQVVAKYKFN